MMKDGDVNAAQKWL